MLLAGNSCFSDCSYHFGKIKLEYCRWLHWLLVFLVFHWKVIVAASHLHLSSAFNNPSILKCGTFPFSFILIRSLYIIHRHTHTQKATKPLCVLKEEVHAVWHKGICPGNTFLTFFRSLLRGAVVHGKQKITDALWVLLVWLHVVNSNIQLFDVLLPYHHILSDVTWTIFSPNKLGSSSTDRNESFLLLWSELAVDVSSQLLQNWRDAK